MYMYITMYTVKHIIFYLFLLYENLLAKGENMTRSHPIDDSIKGDSNSNYNSNKGDSIENDEPDDDNSDDFSSNSAKAIYIKCM